jgi:hypothetical protein
MFINMFIFLGLMRTQELKNKVKKPSFRITQYACRCMLYGMTNFSQAFEFAFYLLKSHWQFS